MKKSLSFKLIASFTSMSVLLVIVSLLAYLSIKKIEGKMTLIAQTAPLIDSAMEMKLSLKADMQMVMEILGGKNMEELNFAWKEHEEVAKRFDIFADAIMNGAETDEGTIYKTTDDGIKKIVMEVDRLHNKEITPRMDKIFGIMSKKISGESVDEIEMSGLDADFDATATKIMEMLGKIEDKCRESMNQAVADADKTSSQSKFQLLVGIAIGIIISLSLAILTTRSIALPIKAVSSELLCSADQVASASEQLSNASEQLSEASNSQASSIEETSSSLEELEGMINNNVQSAEESAKLAENVSNISRRGNETMGNLISSMNNISNSNEKIQALVKVIGEIGEKTAIIDEIVFQTKLLSFNASVEAERAGEHGRGFAVVAQEVGNLAQMSGKAAQEISSIVKNSIKNAENITTENRQRVESGNVNVKEAAAILKEIMEISESVVIRSRQILNASKDQFGGIRNINVAMNQLDKSTQENTAISEEAASASEELSQQAISLNQIVGTLNSIITGTTNNNHELSVNNKEITLENKRVINVKRSLPVMKVKNRLAGAFKVSDKSEPVFEKVTDSADKMAEAVY